MNSSLRATSLGLLATLFALLPLTLQAETLIIDGIETTATEQAPEPGLQKAAVEAGWGAPRAQSQAVGDPPISSWEYDGFIVFFEYDRVLHTVAKR